MTRHELDASMVHYTWSAEHPPRVRVSPGDELTVMTRDGFDGQLAEIDPEALRESTSAIDFSRIAPLTGPIFVEGAEPGSTLEVEIRALEPAGDGYVAVWPEWCDFDFHRPSAVPPTGTVRRVPREELRGDSLDLGGLRVPLRPMLGIVGVAPSVGEFQTLPPREFGGNMDCRLVTTGATVRLPVSQEGALLSLGDGHAAQGDGEISTTGVECPMRVELRVDVNRDTTLEGPALRRDGSYSVITYGRDLDSAARQAIERMHRHLVQTMGVDATDAYMFIGLAGDLEINQVVDTPHMGVRLTVPVETDTT